MSNSTIVDRPLAQRLVSVRDEVINGTVNKSYVKALAQEVQNSKVCEQLENYVITGESDYLDISPPEAFKAIVYASTPVVGAPVMFNNQIVQSPAPGEDADVPLIVGRPLLFDEILTLYWHDPTVGRLEFEQGSQDRVRHAPFRLHHDGNEYDLLGESLCKSFYWPASKPLASELVPWRTRRPQDITTLVSALRRQGYTIASFNGLELNQALLY